MRTVGIIPARYDSSRFPGKPLVDIAGRPMVQWVYERATKAQLLSEVIVATDDRRIEETVEGFGGHVRMTTKDIHSGIDRAARVARDISADVVVNIQGDEPLVDPKAIDQAVQLLVDDENAVAGTLACEVADPQVLSDPDTVRVVMDRSGYALYFSRATIPYVRDCSDPAEWPKCHTFYGHIGLYVYRKDFVEICHAWSDPA